MQDEHVARRQSARKHQAAPIRAAFQMPLEKEGKGQPTLAAAAAAASVTSTLILKKVHARV